MSRKCKFDLKCFSFHCSFQHTYPQCKRYNDCSNCSCVNRHSRNRAGDDPNQSISSSTGRNTSRLTMGDHQYKRYFEKLIESNTQIISSEEASRFVASLSYFESADLLFRLSDSSKYGSSRLIECVSTCADITSILKVFIPLLRILLDNVMSLPLNEKKRNRFLVSIYQVPGLLECISDEWTEESCVEGGSILCDFLIKITLMILEAKTSNHVRTISKILISAQVERSVELKSILMISDEISDKKPGSLFSTVPKTPVVWVTDRTPPGGRHSNDHRDFRDIRVIPTAGEIECEVPPYLPRMAGDNRFIDEGDEERHVLDCQFRLLRQDFISSMKESLISESTLVGLCPVGVYLGSRSGTLPSVKYRFTEPDEVVGLHKAEKADFWSRFRGVEPGSLVCLKLNGAVVRFGEIVVNEELLLDKDGPFIGLQFENYNDPLREIGRAIEFEMVFASTSFFSYKPILNSLQSMWKIPLSHEIVHGRTSTSRPNYLSSRLRLPSDFRSLTLNLDNWSNDDILKETTINESQCEALRLAFTQKVALIQGPPGTGKTFIGSLIARTLIEGGARILCICQTNHALDQFLISLLDHGVRDIVRIGGRSKSERMANYSVFALAKLKTERPYHLRRSVAVVLAQLSNLTDSISKCQRSLGAEVTWEEISDYLCFENDTIRNQLSFKATDGDGFEVVGKRGRAVSADYIFKAWARGDSTPSLPQLMNRLYANGSEIWEMSLPERANLIKQWTVEIKAPTLSSIRKYFFQYRDLKLELEILYREGQREVVQEAAVIGATTSGASKYKELIDSSNANVVIIEEAGEVLEAHVLASLSSHIEHLILIGDHKQLRPKVECYDLTVVANRGYGLDCSLFERLVTKSELPSAMLLVQHRMRPEISALIRMSTYPDLVDDSSVKEHPHLKGISKDIVFIDHRESEGVYRGGNKSSRGDRTKVNMYEVNISIAAIRLLLLQGYSTDQIVLLTPYLGQLRAIIRKMKEDLSDVQALVAELDKQDMLKHFGEDEDVSMYEESEMKPKSVRVSSIDNYQGEESDVVVISLVRSNNEGSIGFLKEPQRVNVLLSRARHGMILIGNSQTFLASTAGQSTWEHLFKHFEATGALMKGLPSYCQLHPDSINELITPSDFKRCRPNGGCILQCTDRLKCGHSCPQMCHPIDREHMHIKCFNQCMRVPVQCKSFHPCDKPCWMDCGKCTKLMEAILPCGHKIITTCHIASSPTLLIQMKCTVLVNAIGPECGHRIEVSCYSKAHGEIQCQLPCVSILECGHRCSGFCSGCFTAGHPICSVGCERTLFCGHICSRLCHRECKACKSKCANRCIHNTCPLVCSEVCSSCVEPCGWHCIHEAAGCDLPCGAPCSRLPCDVRCESNLDCGHRCPSVCGEICPDSRFCQMCGPDIIKSTVVEYIGNSLYSEIILDDDPVIILPCKHFFTVSTLDGIFALDEVYEKSVSSDGSRWLYPKRVEFSDTKSCPNCRSVIHSVFRYGRKIKHAELIILERKHRINIDNRLRGLGAIDSDKMLRNLISILRILKRGPTLKVYEACSRLSICNEVPPPNPLKLIEVLIRIGKYCAEAADRDASSLSKERVLLIWIEAFKRSNRYCGCLRLFQIRC